MLRLNLFTKSMICLLIWGLVCSNISFAGQSKKQLSKDYLSPKINLDSSSIQTAMDIFSRMKIYTAIEKTVVNINEIGRRNFKRELTYQEFFPAVVRIYGEESLIGIDRYFYGLNYKQEKDAGVRSFAQILRTRVIKKTLKFLLPSTVLVGFLMHDIIIAVFPTNVLIAAALLGSMVWIFKVSPVNFLYWLENKAEPKDKDLFNDPKNGLNEKEKNQYFREVKQIIREVVENSFKEKVSLNYILEKIDPIYSKAALEIKLSPLQVNLSSLIFRAI
ncbi:MAG: hypothetical protein KJ915_03755 [Candidatus Omnitrophica bacterium]|nr:hypothetical protein [Candidatus Omnitrophota bacterium]